MKKHIPTDGKGNAIENSIIRSKAKPKPYREPDFLRNYRLARERFFWQKYPEQRAEIEENVNYMKQQWEIQDKRK
jgi:hypothetical protein